MQLLRSLFGISDREHEEETRKKIAGTLILLDEAFKDTLPIWFDFLAVTDPQQPVIKADSAERQRKLFALIQRLVQTMSRREPLIILVDDLLGNDPSIQDLAQKLVSRALGNPFFIEELVRSLVEAGNLAGQHSEHLPVGETRQNANAAAHRASRAGGSHRPSRRGG